MLTVDCNSRYVFADPYKGAMIAVAEAARNIVCSGGKPLGVTNCLNFGNPYDPEVYYQFVHAIKGMGDACRKFDTPVTGGNVSFYNQNPDGAVYPTPTIGMVGIIDDLDKNITLNFSEPSDLIYLLGNVFDDINCSEYLHKILGINFSPAPYFDLDEEFKLHQMIQKLNDEKLIESIHDISEGGLFVTLCESAFNNSLGFEIKTSQMLRKDAFLYGEGQGRVVISLKPHYKQKFESMLHNFPFLHIGMVSQSHIYINKEDWGLITHWKDLYETAISKIVAAEVLV